MTTIPKLHTLLGASLLLAATAAYAKPVNVFILAGQSNMDGQADIRTIDFLGEDKDPAKAALLKTFKPDGKEFVTRDDVWVASRGYHNLRTGPWAAEARTTASRAIASGRSMPLVIALKWLELKKKG